MSMDDYYKAVKKGQKAYQEYLMHGKYPYLQVLEELLNHADVVSEESLGLVQIPADLIMGTYTAGRRTAFAPNFMPLLDDASEFASKWSLLCDAHVEEGIRDPVKAYEFMNRYYIVEGNKRVSVLKYFNAASIPGYVTRVIPKRTDEPENKIYFEFLAFYRLTGINFISFTKEGNFALLMELTGKDPESKKTWTDDEVTDLRSSHVRFKKAFEDKGGDKLSISSDDAMLTYLKLYSYAVLKEELPDDIKSNLDKIWDEVLLLDQDKKPVELLLDAKEESPKKPKGLFSLFSSSPKKQPLDITFIYNKTAQTSAWTYGHELGRLYINEAFKDQITTHVIDDITPGTDAAEEAIEQAISSGSNIIFTTTPAFLDASLKAAIKHPHVIILNCSLNTRHRYIRTYYARLYEAKFISGVIAGCLSESNNIGYIADYPIEGMIANINAFALGAKMVNPNATVHLEWSTVHSRELIMKTFHSKKISYVSSQDMIIPENNSRNFGLSCIKNNELENVALPLWNWGVLYKKLIQSIQSGSWKNDDNDSDGVHALNYWWGFSSDAIDLIYSKKLPQGTRSLIELLKGSIRSGDFHPFYGILDSQNGIVHADENSGLSPEEIIQMDWLCDNVVGDFPRWDELSSEAKAVVRLQGVDSIEGMESAII